MADAYIGEIRLFGGGFAPRGWALCNGQTLSISQYQPLYSLLGTTWGGDGRQTFAVPDLRGRVPVSMGQGVKLTPRSLGQYGGSETVQLALTQIPVHGHALTGTTRDATTQTPGSTLIHATVAGTPTGGPAATGYVVNAAATKRTLNAASLAQSGSGGAHNNQMPTLTLTYIICLLGLYPIHN